MIEFEPWPKIHRLYRPVTITEKIDGTNACVAVEKQHDVLDEPQPAKRVPIGPDEYLVAAQSRKRLITPEQDNYGFAGWVYDNAEYLANTLGPGRHYGEWWGQGINRGYGLDEKRFSLFNVRRWMGTVFEHPQLRLVPVIHHKRDYSDALVRVAMHKLKLGGSFAAPGYTRPEGLVVFHEDANLCLKVSVENDSKPKSVAIKVPELAAA